MGVGGLHDLIVGPVGLAHIRELTQFVGVTVHKVLVSHAAQHPVGDGSHLRTGDGVVGPESTIVLHTSESRELLKLR